MKTDLKKVLNKHRNNIAYKRNASITKDIQSLVKLSEKYIKKLLTIKDVKNTKINFVLNNKYELASIERQSELNLLLQAEDIFKKMKSLRKKINKESNIKGTHGIGIWNLVKDNINK